MDEALDIFEPPEVEVWYSNRLIGGIRIVDEYYCAFQYDAGYVDDGVSISPFYIPLNNNLFVADWRPFDGGFGVFDDSLPDGWGSLVLDRFLAKQGINPASVGWLTRLSLLDPTGRGALEYRPSQGKETDISIADLENLAQQVMEIYNSSDYKGDGIEKIYRYSGSAGGARPKVFIKHDGEEWLVKFAASVDPKDIGTVEYDYSQLARECGIVMPETQLFEGRYFGTKRFDRVKDASGNTERIHTISAAGLLHADYRTPSLDYSTLLVACQQLTRDMGQVEQLFKVMTFNVIIGNLDDHAKNFSFQLFGEDWKLSPGYDLVPSPGFFGEHSTAVNGSGKPVREDLLEAGAKVGMKKGQANTIIDDINRICKSAGMYQKQL